MLYEENITLKSLDDIDVRFGLIYPDVYENVNLSTGFELLYHMLNDRNDCYCERFIYPHTKSLETKSSLKKFDIISFTIHHTDAFFKIIEILKKADIPILRENRTNDDPLIIIGGPITTSNPAPLSKFIDIFCIGEGECILNKLIDKFKKFENPKEHLKEFLDIQGVYIPKFNNHTKIALIDNMDEKFHNTNPIIVKNEDNEIVNTIRLDVLRGCSHGCRFCMAGYLYKPSRETSLEKLIEIAEEARENTGITSVFLVGPDIADHSRFIELIDELNKRNFNVGLPSIRIEKISRKMLQDLKDSGTNSFDIAPESIHKIRISLNKDFTDDKIDYVMKNAFDMGFNLKFLFLIGFPQETNEDIVDLAKYIKSIIKTRDNFDKNLELDFRVSPAVPKAHTPLQWHQFDMDLINYKIDVLLEELNDLNLECIGETMMGITYTNYSINLRFDFNSNENCLKDYILSCGNSDVGDLIMNHSFNSPLSKWEKYIPKYDLDDELPWDCIDLGYRKGFIKAEYKRMLKNKLTLWCGENKCYNCKDNCFKNDFI